MKLLLRKFVVGLGICIGFVLYFGFFYWMDLFKGFFLMVRSESIGRWKRAEDEKFRHQKAHLDDIRASVSIINQGGKNGDN